MPRVHLASLPTPLEELKRLRQAIGGPRILMKRDDLNGLATGGNKLRKLEFLLGDALAKGCDTIITSGTVQTNHGRLTAAACAKLGLACILVLTEPDDGVYEGNRILQKMFGARQVFVDDIDPSVSPERLDKEKLRAGEEKIAQVIGSLKAQGKKPYLIPRGGRSLQGTAGYVHAVCELNYQLNSQGLHANHIFVPGATCSTLTGVLLGTRVFSMDTKVHGVALSRSPAEGRAMVEEEFNKDAAAMGYPFKINRDDITIYGEYMGAGYAVPTEKSREAQLLLARTEAVLLDPTYTAKAMSAYIDLVRQGAFHDDETVVFFHTGGTPLLFTEEMAEWVKNLQP